MKRVAIMAGLTLTTAVALVLMGGLSAASASGGSDAPKPTVEPTLEETGFDGVEWWHVIVGGVLLAVGMGAVVAGSRRGRGE